MAGGANLGDDEMITAINVTPLVDIILVLLIIFMVSTEVIHEADKPSVIPIELPTAASAEEMLAKGLLNLVIDGQGQLYLNGVTASYSKVDATVRSLQLRKIIPQALISADKNVAHGEVAYLMDFLRLRKVKKIAINTKKQEIE
jgi:biopolymer transport protein TolR